MRRAVKINGFSYFTSWEHKMCSAQLHPKWLFSLSLSVFLGNFFLKKNCYGYCAMCVFNQLYSFFLGSWQLFQWFAVTFWCTGVPAKWIHEFSGEITVNTCKVSCFRRENGISYNVWSFYCLVVYNIKISFDDSIPHVLIILLQGCTKDTGRETNENW